MKRFVIVPIFVLGCCLGCEHAGLRVEAPPMPEPIAASNDLIKAEYLGMGPVEDGKGVACIRVTNTTPSEITLGGSQGSTIPAKEGAKAWLVYRGDHQLSRFLDSKLKLALAGGVADLSVDVPEEGVSPLPAGASRMVLVSFELPENVKNLSIDLSPLVSAADMHDAKGDLRDLYLTIPVKDQPSLADRAKQMIEQTKFGFQLTSDDI